MAKEVFNTSKVETYLYGLLNNQVSAQTFAGSLPDTIRSEWNDMVLIDCGTSIRDRHSIADAVVLIWLYARPKGDGTKNVPKFSEMETALNNVIDNAHDEHYHLARNACYSDYDSNRKWHTNIVELILKIN